MDYVRQNVICPDCSEEWVTVRRNSHTKFKLCEYCANKRIKENAEKRKNIKRTAK